MTASTQLSISAKQNASQGFYSFRLTSRLQWKSTLQNCTQDIRDNQEDVEPLLFKTSAQSVSYFFLAPANLCYGKFPALQICLIRTEQRERIISLDLLEHCSSCSPGYCCFFLLQEHIVVYVRLVLYHDPKVLYAKPAFQPVSPQCILVHGFIPHQVQHFAVPLVEFHQVSPFLQLRSLWMAT